MNQLGKLYVFAAILFPLSLALADTHYVATNGLHVSPFTEWENASTNIQDAISVSNEGDAVVVSNGVYSTGGISASTSGLVNRITMTNRVTLTSVSGPEVTIVIGQSIRQGEPVRCAFVGANSVLAGFTLTNGCARVNGDALNDQSGGGIWAEGGTIISNCNIVGCSATNYGGGVYLSYGGMLQHCQIQNNSALSGGGIYFNGGGTIEDSILDGNTASYDGGGCYCKEGGVIRRSTIQRNQAMSFGGGLNCISGGIIEDTLVSSNSAVYGGGLSLSSKGLSSGASLTGCIVVDNHADFEGGGLRGANSSWIIDNCVLSNNVSGIDGGGVYLWEMMGSIVNSIITGNVATNRGGGISSTYSYWCTVECCIIIGNTAASGGGGYCNSGWPVVNCTISSNTATVKGGGVYSHSKGTFFNAIIAHNKSPQSDDSNWYDNKTNAIFQNCCTFPSHQGDGNVTNDPLFVDSQHGDFRLTQYSDCIDSGNNDNSSALADLEGKPRILGIRVDMGAYEYIPFEQDSDADNIPDWWEWAFSGSLTNMAPNVDSDKDGNDNLSEYIAITDPTNSLSCFKIICIQNQIGSWQVKIDPALTSRNYRIYSTTNLVNVSWQTNDATSGTGSNLVISVQESAINGYFRGGVELKP